MCHLPPDFCKIETKNPVSSPTAPMTWVTRERRDHMQIASNNTAGDHTTRFQPKQLGGNRPKATTMSQHKPRTQNSGFQALGVAKTGGQKARFLVSLT